MSTPPEVLHAHYRFGPREAFAARLHAWRASPTVWVFRLIQVFGLGCLLCALIPGLIHDPLARLSIGIAGAYLGLVRPLVAAGLLQAWIAGRQTPAIEVSVEANADGLYWRDSQETQFARWASFQKIRRFRKGFLLYSSERLYHWLPITAFSAPEEVERIADWMRTKIADYREH